MKKIFKQSLTSLALCILITSCGGGGGNYNYNSDDTVSSDYAEVHDNAAEEAALQQKLAEIKNMPELQDYKGLYKVTDEDGNTFDIYFTKEDAVIITTGKGDVYYCTYDDFTSIDKGLQINLSEGEMYITFKGGLAKVQNFNTLEIKDNWLYASTSYANANNPNWRLPLTIEKAFKSKNSTSSSYSTTTTTIHHTTNKEIKNSVDEIQAAADEARKKASNIKSPTEEEIRGMETIMYGYNEAAWRAKRRADKAGK